MDEVNTTFKRRNVPDSEARTKENKIANGKDTKPELAEKTNPTVYIVFISLLLDLLAFTMILPLLPSLLEFYRKNDKGEFYNFLSTNVKKFQELLGAPERYNSVLFGGALGSMYSFLQFVASPIVGALSDVYGRKPVMILCTVGIAFSYFLWAISSNFALFVLARFVGGLSKGNISLCMAIITDVSTIKNRGKGMALVGIAFSLGFIMGPMIGAMFSMYSDKSSKSWFWLPAMFAMGLAVSDLLFLLLCLKETLPKEKRAKNVLTSLGDAFNHISISSLFNFRAVKSLDLHDMKVVKSLGFIYFVYLLLYSALEFTVTFLMFHKFGYTSMDQAKMFLTTGVVMALLQGSVVRRLPIKHTKKSAVFGLYLIVPAYIFVGLATNSIVLYTGMIIYAISTAFVVTCMTTIVSKYGQSDEKGTVLGIFRSLGALARALGPIIGSTAFWWLGSSPTYICGGLILLYPSVLLHRLEVD